MPEIIFVTLSVTKYVQFAPRKLYCEQDKIKFLT